MTMINTTLRILGSWWSYAISMTISRSLSGRTLKFRFTKTWKSVRVWRRSKPPTRTKEVRAKCRTPLIAGPIADVSSVSVKKERFPFNDNWTEKRLRGIRYVWVSLRIFYDLWRIYLHVSTHLETLILSHVNR